MKKLALPGLAALALVIGSPHDDYSVELTPHGNAIERKLTFDRADGTNPNEVPNYHALASTWNGFAATTTWPPRQLHASRWGTN